MKTFWSLSNKYPSFRQFGLCACLLGSWAAKAQSINRMPASYVPDDDVIVKPVDNEISFYQRFVLSDQSQEVVESRNQFKVWQENQDFAERYGMDSTLAGSPYFVPTQEVKFEYFKERYMRYLRRKGEQPFKDMPKEWYDDYRASNQVDTINEMEERFKKTNKKSSTGEILPKALQEKEVSLSKKIKFIFQPRVEQGLVMTGLKTPYGKARVWVGINGRTEVNIKQSVDSLGFSIMYNYDSLTKEYFTSADQRLGIPGLYLRVTSLRDPAKANSLNRSGSNHTAMLLYATRF